MHKKKRNSTEPDTTYEVGYGKPPKANQFPKGRTGNPRGKRPGEENIISAFRRIVSKRIKMKDGDQIRTIRLYEAVILQNCNAAMRRDSLAMGNIFRLAEASGELIDRTNAKQRTRPLMVPEKITIEEFMARHGRTIEAE
jgi:hypothetical protein